MGNTVHQCLAVVAGTCIVEACTSKGGTFQPLLVSVSASEGDSAMKRRRRRRRREKKKRKKKTTMRCHVKT